MLTRSDMIAANRAIIQCWILDSGDTDEDTHAILTAQWCLRNGAVSADDIRQQSRDQRDSAKLFPGSKRDRDNCLYAADVLASLADKLHSFADDETRDAYRTSLVYALRLNAHTKLAASGGKPYWATLASWGRIGESHLASVTHRMFEVAP